MAGLEAVSRAALRAAREPMVQFLVVGAALFGANLLINGPEAAPQGQDIVVTEGRVSQIAESYRLLAGRLPSKRELETLVDDFVTEEVDYREAVAMGLDTDDTIVRRRMRQKLEFLIQDAQPVAEPTEAELREWLAGDEARYSLPGRIAFTQVLVSRDRHGARAPDEARRTLAALRGGADPSGFGDETMLPSVVPLTTEQGVASTFGDDFAAAVFHHPPGGWMGPIASPYGEHLVLVTDRQAGQRSTFEDVRARLRDDWVEARRIRQLAEAQTKLRQHYKISIAWPPGYQAPASPEEPPHTFAPGGLPEE